MSISAIALAACAQEGRALQAQPLSVDPRAPAVDSAAAALSLSELRWRWRVLIVWADAEGFAGQRSLLSREGVRDRDLVFFHFAPGSTKGEAYVPTPSGEALTARVDIAASDVSAPAKGEAFAAALIGKDGMEKGRWAEPVGEGALFALIDSMPMRRREMLAHE